MSSLPCRSNQDEENFSAQLADLLQLSASFSCVCEQDESGYWRISSKDSDIIWSLQQTDENRWLLVIKDKPQINLEFLEALKFLHRQKAHKS